MVRCTKKEKYDKIKKINDDKIIEYNEQINDLNKWKLEENNKEIKRLEQIEQIKIVRQQQLNELKKKK